MLIVGFFILAGELSAQTAPLKSSKKNITTLEINHTTPVLKKLDQNHLVFYQSSAPVKTNNRSNQIIFQEGFEAGFPEYNYWWLYWNEFSPYTWDESTHKPHSGNYSVWCAEAVMSDFYPDLNAADHNYANDQMSWMIWGPFNLEDAVLANLEFWYWYETETDYDYFYYGLSSDGINYVGQYLTGFSEGWQQVNINLGNPDDLLGYWLGKSGIWLGFLFESDTTVTEQGAFVDDILITKNTGIVSESDISVSPDFLDFEDVMIDSYRDLSLVITNLGLLDLDVTNISSNNPDFTANPSAFVVSPGYNVPVTIRFSPSSEGEQSAWLTIQSNDPDQSSLQIFITGYGVGQTYPDIDFALSSIDFGDIQVGKPESWELAIFNVGEANLQIDQIYTQSSEFQLSATTLPKILSPDQNFVVEVYFTPSRAGVFTDSVIVHSNDPDEGIATVGLSGVGIDNTPPVIDYQYPVTTSGVSQDITITADIRDNSENLSAVVYYRKGGDLQYNQTNMTGSGNRHTGYIPATHVTTRGVEYYIWASDGQNVSTHPETDYIDQPNIVTITTENAAKSKVQPGGSAETAYRLFSVPLDLTASEVSSVLFDDLGNYDNTQWRFFRQEGGIQYEYPNAKAQSFELGKAYWLIIKDPGKTVDAGTGGSIPTGEAFSINLAPGWNDIGLPFDFPISWENIEVNREQIDGPYYYQGNWILPNSIKQLESWEGYTVKNLTSQTVTLNINPVAADASSRAFQKSITSPSDYKNEWSLQIMAYAGEASDEYNYLGCQTEATPQKDLFDYSEPPGIGNYVSLYFPHPEWKPYPGNFTTDIRPELIEGENWQMIVECNIEKEPIRLSWLGTENIPADLDIVLIDLDKNLKLNLRDKKSYTFFDSRTRAFSIIVGRPEFVEALEAQMLIPQRYVLYQNFPNPFNPKTRIGYGLPEPGKVKIDIINLLGQVVLTLVDQYQEAGSFFVEWDGRKENGQPVTSGLYFYRMKTEKFLQIRKLMLIR
jgi:hypothetical protein